MKSIRGSCCKRCPGVKMPQRHFLYRTVDLRLPPHSSEQERLLCKPPPPPQKELPSSQSTEFSHEGV
ncbi:uncharacterized [Tachysurus ichikawai]